MERILVGLMENPWAFAALGFFAIVSAIQPLLKIAKFLIALISNAVKNGILSSVDWMKRSAKNQANNISRSESQTSGIALMIMENTLLIGSTVLSSTFFIISAIFIDTSILLHVSQLIMGLSPKIATTFVPVFFFLTLFLLNIVALMGYTLYCMFILTLLMTAGEDS